MESSALYTIINHNNNYNTGHDIFEKNYDAI